MITIDQRIFLVFLILGCISFIILKDLFVQNNFESRSHGFLKLVAIFFPFVDLQVPPSEINIKVLEVITILFVIINFKSFFKYIRGYVKVSVVIFIFTLFFIAIFSYFPANSFISVFRLGSLLTLIILLLISLNSGFNIFDSLLDIIVLWAVLFFLLQLIFGVDFTLYYSLNSTALNDLRYTSFSQDAQKLAQIAYMLCVIYLGQLYINRNNSNIKSYFIITSCIILGLATGSRASLLGFGFVLILMFFRRLNLKNVLLVISFSVVVLFMEDTISKFQVFQRMNEVNQAFEGRYELFWLKAIDIFNSNQLFGVGYGNFGLYVTDFVRNFTYGEEGQLVDQPESGYLLWLTETGIIGAIFYIYFILQTLLKDTSINKSSPFKFAFIVWMFGFISVYSLSDSKVFFIVLVCVAMIFSNGFSGNRHIANNSILNE